jgi:selenide,water dikinase
MKVNLAKRRQVMERSMRLGHCICEPRRACPCDVFRDQGICPCAGERPDPVDLAQVKLTSLVRNPGCASKIPPGELEGMLRRLPPVNDPAVISGLAAADDAAVYRIADDLCLVQTVDVFTPCVDDPHLFGRICAANCLSDIYAMGGEPRTALSILAFPSETLHGEIMYQMLAGAMETLAEAGVALVGGHSIKDEEIKLGFAVTGVIDPRMAAALDDPRVGDVLVLTKPLGTGVLAFAQQVGRAHVAGMAAAAASMATLNRAAAEAMRESGASACTDVTGFGLFAHLVRMLRARGFSAEIFADALPAFDGVLELLRNDVVPGAVERNREFVGDDLNVEPGVDEARVNLGFDAQTSGGLLIAIALDRLETLQRSLAHRGVSGLVIGRITQRTGASISVACTAASSRTIFKQENPGNTSETMNTSSSTETHQPGCCADIFGNSTAPSSATESQKAFGALIRSVQAGGVLTEKAKELILFALVVQSRCAPCFDAHFHRARELGITQAELDEAAWCAIAMGGAPVKMFYQESLRRAQQPGAS